MQQRWCGVILLLGGTLGLLGCTLVRPEQPDMAQPHALLVFPEAIRLVALDTQNIDPRLRITTLRVSPGLHRLRLAYAGKSPQHVGQQIDPLCLETQAGQQYVFETKTLGIIWRAWIEKYERIPGYCTTHTCPETAAPPLPQLVTQNFMCKPTSPEGKE